MIHKMFDIKESKLWEGKPDRITYVIGPLTPYYIAIGWGIIDFTLLSSILSSNSSAGNDFIVAILLFAIHLAPVWIAAFGPIYRFFKWKNIEYVITNKHIFIKTGASDKSVTVISISDILSTSIDMGVVGNIRNCGTILLNPDRYKNHIKADMASLLYISDPHTLYKIVQELSTSAQR